MINGKAVRDARIAAGFPTQESLAESIGCSRITVSRAENGKGGSGVLQKIADATGVAPGMLMKITGDSAPMPVTPQEREILAAYRRLDPITQARASGFIVGLAAGGGAEESGDLGAALAGELAAAEARRKEAEKQRQQTQTPGA